MALQIHISNSKAGQFGIERRCPDHQVGRCGFPFSGLFWEIFFWHMQGSRLFERQPFAVAGGLTPVAHWAYIISHRQAEQIPLTSQSSTLQSSIKSPGTAQLSRFCPAASPVCPHQELHFSKMNTVSELSLPSKPQS